MKKESIDKIVNFINDEISPYDLNLDYEIEDNILLSTFKGHFTSYEEIELKFRCESEYIEIYGLCESYIYCGTREFWIELMGRLK